MSLEKQLEEISKQTIKRNRYRFCDSKGLFEYFNKYFNNLEQEVFTVVTCDCKNGIIGGSIIGLGGIVEVRVDIKILFRKIFSFSGVTSIVVMHNHPSGDTTPSSYDLDITKKISAACEILDIRLLDHIIFGEDAYCSLRDMGIIR